MRNSLKSAMTALGIALTAASAFCAEPEFLAADELRALILGKTIEALDSEGFTYRVYFDASGQRLAKQGDREQVLPWRIRPDGSHCVATGTGEDCARVARNGNGTYTRYREGTAVTHWLKLLPGKALDIPASAGAVADAAGTVVAVRQLAAQNYEVRLSGQSIRTVQGAQAMATTVAASVCKGRAPVLGTYRFESTEFLADAVPTSQPQGLQLTQKFSCEASPQPAQAQAQVPAAYSKKEKDDAAAKVLDETERYFRLLGEGRVNEAFLQLDPDSDIWNEASWKKLKQEFVAIAGALHRIAITKVTVYENPKSATKPGLYVAADYRNVWRDVPVQCGYLMWLRTPSGEFRIIREETGHVTAEQLAAAPPAQRASVEQALRCR
jgi:hypothetical protein